MVLLKLCSFLQLKEPKIDTGIRKRRKTETDSNVETEQNEVTWMLCHRLKMVS